MIIIIIISMLEDRAGAEGKIKNCDFRGRE